MMAADFDREEVRRGLDLLYPADHGMIELDILKKSGILLSCRSANRELIVDEIEKYDPQDDTAAIYTSLNRLDVATFTQAGHVLSIDEPVGPGPRINAGNVARVTSILFDIDPFRANDDKKDSTTDAEHEAAIKAADFLKHRLSFLGWPEPVVGDSGNGAALRYSCSLPASKETTDLISRALRAANAMLPAEMAAQVEVDVAVFDLPRISKTFGTTTRKGPGTPERPHRRATIISAPEKLEPVSIDCIIKLAGTSKAQEEQSEPQQEQERKGEAEPLSPDAAERLQELFAADPMFKTDLFTPAPIGKRSTAEHHMCARLWEAGFSETEIYAIMASSPQSKWQERGDSYRWSTIKAAVAAAEASHREREKKARDAEAKPKELRREDVCTIDYNDKGEEKSCKLAPTRAAGAIMKLLTLAMTKDDDAIYYFDNGIYHPGGDRIIDMALCNVAGDAVDIKKLKEVLRRVQNSLLSDPVTFDHDPHIIGVKNGVVDLQTGKFREYRPEDLITDQIDVAYDPKARCPRFLQFLEEVEPVAIDRLMLVDWFAIHAIKEMFPYVMFLLGLGRNGKGVFERVLKKFFKEESFSEMQLEELNVKNNRFAGAALKGKRGQIVSEAGEERKPGSKRTIPTNYLKFSTGDGIIDSDQKGTVRTRFKPFYKATVDTNDMPLITDLSRGWAERFCKANLPYVLVDNPAPDTLERKKDPKLFEKLTTADEISGILNLILARTPDIIKTGTITKRSGAAMFAEYQQQSSSIKTFLDMFCDYKATSDKSKDVFLDSIYEKYEEWCNRKVADKVDGIRFGKAVKTFCRGAEPERIHDGDKKRRIYHGLSFDLKRYQAHWDHYQTIKGPLKTVTGPLGPLNDEYSTIWENLVKKYGKEMDETKNSSILASMGPIAISKNTNGPDIGFNGPENQFNGPDSDLQQKNTSGGPNVGREEPQQAGVGPHPLRDAPIPATKAIYVSKGAALEYADYSLNLHNGCSHDCQYCYEKSKFIGTCETRVKKSSLENIEADLMRWQGERKQVHLTFRGDPYDLGRQDNSDVRAVLELFKKYNHPFQVLTKGGTKAVQDFDLYGEGCRFGCTLTFMDENDSRHWEPGAALPADRIAALKEAHSRGISTWVSLEPVIDHVQTLALIEATHEFVGHYGVGKINHKPGIEKNIDWPKFRADAEALLKKYGKSYQIKEDLLKATPTLAKVRILKPDGYRSQFPNGPNKWIDRLCACGEVIEVDLQRAEELIKRGVAVAVEAEA